MFYSHLNTNMLIQDSQFSYFRLCVLVHCCWIVYLFISYSCIFGLYSLHVFLCSLYLESEGKYNLFYFFVCVLLFICNILCKTIQIYLQFIASYLLVMNLFPDSLRSSGNFDLFYQSVYWLYQSLTLFCLCVIELYICSLNLLVYLFIWFIWGIIYSHYSWSTQVKVITSMSMSLC